MRKIILIIIALSLLITLALVLTACPRTTELEPGGGDVTTTGTMPELGERETEALPEDAVVTPEDLEGVESVEDGAEAGDEEAVEPEGEEEETPADEEGGDEEETEEAADEAATE